MTKRLRTQSSSAHQDSRVIQKKPLAWLITLALAGVGTGCALNDAPSSESEAEQQITNSGTTAEGGNGSGSARSGSARSGSAINGSAHSGSTATQELDSTQPATEHPVTLPARPRLADTVLEERAEMAATQLKRKESKAYVAGNMAISQGYHSAPQAMMVAPEVMPEPYPGWDDSADDLHNEKYDNKEINSVKTVAEHPVSTFSIDVDTGSYSNVRRILNQGALPPKHAVRVEEMVNYFDYQYPQPDLSKAPFSVNTELAQAPWSDDHLLLRVGLQGFEPEQAERSKANLVFLLDVSGSMNSANKLPLLKKSLMMLTSQLTEQDKVSIVVYAGASGVVLEPTSGNDKYKIEQALQGLQAGGSTNGQQGIQLAYQLAEQSFVEGGINRVLLATDGDFNVGMSDVDALKELIERKRKKGIALTTLGFGTGNYNDHLMEQLADVGNGNYAYIDTLHEARKVLVEELNATLMTIAKDVKIQLEFNPQWVAEYRLIGYENRMLAREDFNNDTVDSGEIGAGHRVTALYELALVDSAGKRVEPLRYQSAAESSPGVDAKSGRKSDELAFLRLRYKQPSEDKSHLIEQPITVSSEVKAFEHASADFRFAAIVAGFGQKLRDDKYLNAFDYPAMINLAQGSKGQDPFGYRNEFIQLVRLAESLSKQ
jgi:Ca-activated chloride channel family protein